jgi:hypothetical protein
MAVTRTDRDRRILGDRVVARADEFRGIDEAVGRVFDRFVGKHGELSERTAARLREEGEDEKARRVRDETAVDGLRQYSWAYHELASLLGDSWTSGVDEAKLALTRARLFPLGSPTEVGMSHQRTLDGLIHLVDGMASEPGVVFPEAFRSDAGRTRDALLAAIGQVTADGAETESVTSTQLQARVEWDQHWQALRDVSAGFLRLAGELARHPGLFRPLTRAGRGAGTATGAEEAVTPGADGPEVELGSTGDGPAV